MKIILLDNNYCFQRDHMYKNNLFKTRPSLLEKCVEYNYKSTCKARIHTVVGDHDNEHHTPKRILKYLVNASPSERNTNRTKARQNENIRPIRLKMAFVLMGFRSDGPTPF